ncbi:Serine acetyltransferase-like protein [Rhizorhabdus wittichii RW1]|uniref:Serine acetyltransferase-like protein n=1 Tax=Rhizorhabdus wittichii (strain DSM 6014 / CCUG 31198 / JCM 15750 / NBRC 105917 / EY 4224 / RW1) TaxID=392499 RepID=A0A9J9HCR5_RHIWR|nr:Serine acetyltransferase-like protein [Rhizorhabdus wittichii RW1]
MPNIFRILKEDWRSNRGAGLVSQLFLINYRLGRIALQKKEKYGTPILLGYLPLLLNARFLSLFLGCSIPFSTKLGRRIRFQHGLQGIFISGLASVGDDCLILHQVTIGSNIGSRSGRPAAPRIGNRIFIGVGAKIIGDLDVGDDAMIGAQALVIRSVPSGARCHAPSAEIRMGLEA